MRCEVEVKDMKEKKIGRREFIRGAAITGAGLALGGAFLYGRRSLAALLAGNQGAVDRAIRDHREDQMSDADAQATVAAYMMTGPGEAKVVHIHSDQATDWDFGSSYYGNHVDQDAVNEMVDRGVQELTGASTVADAWRALIPAYTSGEAIAIKVNLNNAFSCGDGDNDIDALIHPINAAVRGLKQIGVAEQDVWVYEAVRRIPDRFANGCLYPGVRFFGNCRQSVGWSSNDPDAYVTFSRPGGSSPSSMRVPDVLINATYLINIPIMKTHNCAGVSLSFKNHCGTIRDPGGLHDYIFPEWSRFLTDYNPLIEVYQNPHVGAKTVLTIGDGLYGAWSGYTTPPVPWTTFGDAASNSLFFSTDPVALDCVMYDFLAAETTVMDDSECYMSAAADAGLGVCEHGDPWGGGYSQIDYERVEV
jgi:hypothetical protein